MATRSEPVLLSLLPTLCQGLQLHKALIKPILLTLARNCESFLRALLDLLLSPMFIPSHAIMVADLCLHNSLPNQDQCITRLRDFVFQHIATDSRTDAMLRLMPFLKALARTMELSGVEIDVSQANIDSLFKCLSRNEGSKTLFDVLARLLCLALKRSHDFDSVFLSLFKDVSVYSWPFL